MIALRWTVLIAVLVAAVARSQAELLDEGPYAELLVRHTESVGSTVGTRVDYAALAASPDWKRLIRSLSRVEPAALATRDQKLAFWINAYNILAIDIVLRHYPVESIRDIGSLFRPVWDREKKWSVFAGRSRWSESGPQRRPASWKARYEAAVEPARPFTNRGDRKAVLYLVEMTRPETD